ncbi:hypothetical protein, partial [Schaalia sp. lx-100]|uniref:hypothetical protein n=1 Tax=Schaalia sp. lx-100 TaxID=2899081 RepID=UPI001E4DD05D
MRTRSITYTTCITIALAFVALFLYMRPALAETNVSTEQELREALTRGDSSIALSSDITITSPLVFTAGTSSLDLGGHTLSLGARIDNMFEVSSAQATLSVSHGTIDGRAQGRLFFLTDDATLNLQSVTVENGSTQLFDKKLEDGTNKQFYDGGAVYALHAKLNMTDTIFQNNSTKTDAPVQEAGKTPATNTHGGAIYSGTSTITVHGGKFINNVSGKNVSGYYGEGGAIKMEGGSLLTINPDANDERTVFDKNHTFKSSNGDGGLQGGAIEVTGDGTRVNIQRADFTVIGGFDTGGAIKFEGSGTSSTHNIIADSTFTLVGKQLPQQPEPSGYFGTSGGSIMTENSYVTIERSTFTMKDIPSVAFAGGHIDVVGGGELNLFDSRLSGNGVGWNEAWRSSAKYGGALAFENGASARAHIRGTTFTGFTTDHVGGIIAVGHRTGSDLGASLGQTSVRLLLENSTLSNSRAYTWNANSAGAGLYIAAGSEVEIRGGSITDAQANYGGAVYNLGKLTLTNKARIISNNATQMTAGIFNDGYLNAHSAEFSNNSKTTDAFFAGGNHELSSGEHSGGTIYARKDVIIGSDAKFSTNARDDVRVIEGQSSVILSGPRTSQVNVSLSEKENAAGGGFFSRFFGENAHRHVGYLVARGLTSSDILSTESTPADMASNYTVTPADAQSFHYVSNTVESSKIAAYGDHTGIALWDYVFDPDASTVVLGQRARMVYHTNHADATITDGVADSDPAGQKLNQDYTFYATGKVSIDNKPATELTVIDSKPTLRIDGKKWDFRHWHEPSEKGNPLYNFDTATPSDASRYNFEERTFSHEWNPAGNEITDILNVAAANTLHTYAVYQPTRNIVVSKVWNVTDDSHKAEVTFVLTGGDTPVEKTLAAGETT